MADLEMTRGDDRTISVTLTDGAVFSESDVVRFTIKRRHGDSDANAILARSTTAGDITITAGTASTSIPAAATDALPAPVRLVYDWQAVTAAGKVTLDKGTITVEPDVTRT